MREFKVLPMVYQYRSRFYQGIIGNTIGTNGYANGTIGSPNGIIGTIDKPLVKLPMVPLQERPVCVHGSTNGTNGIPI